MSAVSLRLPESLHKKARELAKSEDVSINQLISTALAEKMSALLTVEYLEERAARATAASSSPPCPRCATVSPTKRM